MSWGISQSASEKEKIKAEFADTLNGYNSCGEISYSVYSEVFDIAMDLLEEIYEQGKRDAQSTIYDTDKVIEQLEELEKEHPYRVIGQPDTYSQYNEGWCDCLDRVITIVEKGGRNE